MDAVKPSIDTAQVGWELDQLLAIVERHKPQTILEIGVYEGGTLWHWLRTGADVVAIDDTMRSPGPYEWMRWAADAAGELKLLHGRSTDQAILEQAADRGPYDLVFIDGDHTYNSVRDDWLSYRPLVSPGGLVAFHDIVPRPSYGVDQLWNEIKAGHPTVEIVEGSRPNYCGIGVAWM